MVASVANTDARSRLATLGWTGLCFALVGATVACGDDGAASGTESETELGTGSTGDSVVTTVSGETGGTTGDAETDSADSTGEPPVPPVNEPPVAVFTAEPVSGMAPLDVALDGSMSTDADGTIVAYDWDFGEGSEGDGQTTDASYAAAGCFDIQLTVTDDDGATATASQTIVVVDQPAAKHPTFHSTWHHCPAQSCRETWRPTKARHTSRAR